MTTEAPDLSAIAADLRVTAGRLSRRLRAEAGLRDFSISQGAVLRRLYEGGPATTSALARLEGMRPQSMSATVASLEEIGFIGRRPDPDDGRATQLFLTEVAERNIVESRAVKQGWLARTMAERLTSDEQRRLGDAVELIDRLLAP